MNLDAIVSDQERHGRFLNTLSYLENCGARLIASCEHPTQVRQEMLKHAAEEFRHAHYLKQQLGRIPCQYDDYRIESLLGGWAAVHYLRRLSVAVCRLSREFAYPLTTYAIELRAQAVYPLYQAALRRHGAKVQVQSILLEEKEHLADMEAQLKDVPRQLIEGACRLEERLFARLEEAFHLP